MASVNVVKNEVEETPQQTTETINQNEKRRLNFSVQAGAFTNAAKCKSFKKRY
jgi:cell division septation protein DedD